MFRRLFSVLLGVLALTAAAAALAESFYLPGTYTATAQGCGGGVTVEVIFDETQIASVTVVEHSETAGICEPAIESIPELIVEGQTLAVDAVTGATVTSTAILTAVADCVTQAGGDVDALLSASDGTVALARRFFRRRTRRGKPPKVFLLRGLTRTAKTHTIALTTKYLIKSGRGTGPMTPANRQRCMVANPAACIRWQIR